MRRQKDLPGLIAAKKCILQRSCNFLGPDREALRGARGFARETGSIDRGVSRVRPLEVKVSYRRSKGT
jgi:hypothetical protein